MCTEFCQREKCYNIFISIKQKKSEKVTTRYILSIGNDNELLLQINNDNKLLLGKKNGNGNELFLWGNVANPIYYILLCLTQMHSSVLI